MIKLIASDLDGTALNNGKLSDTNKKAIQMAVDAGYMFAVVTGRALCTIPDGFYDVDKFTYAITNNGARLDNVRTGEILLNITVNPEDVRKLTEIGKRFNTTFEVFMNGKAYVSQEYYDDPVKYGMLPQLVEYIHYARTPVDNIFEHIENNINEIVNFVFVIPNKEIHDKVVEEVRMVCPDTFKVTCDIQWVEIMNSKTNKGEGLKALASYLGISMSEIAVIGDADNDIEMLEMAGLSIAMGNGSPAVKAIADYVTDDVANDGVARAIEKIIDGTLTGNT